MILTHRLQEAINEAARLHRDQLRYDAQKTPYITHLVGVMILLSSATHDEDILVAGLMHDSLEDVEGYTPEKLEASFGKRVCEIVLGVTEQFKLKRETPPSWKEEKILYLQNLETAPEESVMVSLADKIQNTRSLIEMIKSADKDALSKFGSSTQDKLWFHGEVLAVGQERLGNDHILAEEFEAELNELKRALGVE